MEAAAYPADLYDVHTSVAPPMPPQQPRRSRFGYTRQWWGETARSAPASRSYWVLTRHPSLCLLFVLPLVAIYEVGIRIAGGGQPDSLRAGIDTWIHHGLAQLGMTAAWLPPIVLVSGLAFWLRSEGSKPFWRPEPLAGMTLESLALAVGLIGLSTLVDLGLSHLEHSQVPLRVAGPTTHPVVAARSLAFIGAGVYEEAVFRLALIPAVYGLGRLLLLPGVLASTVAITASSLLFSLAHHVGVPGEAFTWYAFVFRWLAGVYFSWVFVVRGFGIAVGTHVAYDCLVGWLSIAA
jgi:hypothetical protein